jgi:hypothetical protein
VGGGEVAVGPFLGELPGFAEHDRHGGPADLEFGESVGDHGRADPVELEHLRIAVLDNDGCTGQRGELAEGVPQLPLIRLDTRSGSDLRSTAAICLPSMVMP